MLTKNEYNTIVDALKLNTKIDVYEDEGFYDFINYKHKDFKGEIFGVSKDDDEYLVNTLFGGMTFISLNEVVKIIKKDWNEDNWEVTIEDGEDIISLKEVI